jgi:hypothetical protein
MLIVFGRLWVLTLHLSWGRDPCSVDVEIGILNCMTPYMPQTRHLGSSTPGNRVLDPWFGSRFEKNPKIVPEVPRTINRWLMHHASDNLLLWRQAAETRSPSCMYAGRLPTRQTRLWVMARGTTKVAEAQRR